jgi:hypothetical protein
MDFVTIRLQLPPAATTTAVPYATVLAGPEKFYQVRFAPPAPEQN